MPRGFFGGWYRLVVLAEAPGQLLPGEGRLHHPAPREDAKARQRRPLQDLPWYDMRPVVTKGYQEQSAQTWHRHGAPTSQIRCSAPF